MSPNAGLRLAGGAWTRGAAHRYRWSGKAASATGGRPYLKAIDWSTIAVSCSERFVILVTRNMSAIDRAIAANRQFAIHYDPEQVSPRPRLSLPSSPAWTAHFVPGSSGWSQGDVHMIRDAGGIVTDDAIVPIFVSRSCSAPKNS